MKPEKKKLPKKCKQWPRCRCIVQGYVNFREHNYCGRKPSMDKRSAP